MNDVCCGGCVLPKGHILLVHPGGSIQSDIELRVVCVTAMISHAQYSRAGVSNGIALTWCGREIETGLTQHKEQLLPSNTFPYMDTPSPPLPPHISVYCERRVTGDGLTGTSSPNLLPVSSHQGPLCE